MRKQYPSLLLGVAPEEVKEKVRPKTEGFPGDIHASCILCSFPLFMTD